MLVVTVVMDLHNMTMREGAKTWRAKIDGLGGGGLQPNNLNKLGLKSRGRGLWIQWRNLDERGRAARERRNVSALQI